MNRNEIDGNIILNKSLKKLNIDICALIAETSFWAHPDVVRKRPVWFPNTRRGKVHEKGKKVNGILIDDNTKANNAIKQACKINPKYFSVCHIYPGTAYDKRYHTAIANLVLLPRALSSLTDYCQDITRVLQYRSWELYQWKPKENNVPEKPENYPNNWKAIDNPKIKTDTKSYILSLVKRLFPKFTDIDIQNLQDANFCKNKLNLLFPLLLGKNKITEKLKRRYYTNDLIDGKYYICNHWYKSGMQENIYRFKNYALNREIN